LTNSYLCGIIITERKKEVIKMFTVKMSFDCGDTWYTYGTYSNRDKANEVALTVGEERECWTIVEKVGE
jgi:hypothetical protein